VNILNLLELAAKLEAERVIVSDARWSLTAGQLWSAAHEFAREIESASPGPVGYLGVNGVPVAVALFGAAAAGRPFSPLNYRADAGQLTHNLDVLRPGVIVTDTRYEDDTRAAAGSARVLTTDTVRAITGSSEPGHTTPAPADDPAVLLFTSGTSSAPKLVVLRHRHLSSYVLGSGAPLSAAATAASLISTPPYHIAAMANVLSAVYSGRRMYFLETFTAEGWLAAARAERVTHAMVVPTTLARITASLEAGDRPPSTLETLAYGGAPAPRGLVERALAQFAPTTGFVNAYGLTETSSTITVLTPADHQAAAGSDDPVVRRRLDSVGRATPGIELRLSDPVDGIGEILVRGSQISGEYTGGASRIDADGWFHTGDLASVDVDGYVYITGRADDMIIRGGENISPREIEEVLLEHPGVQDAAVVGISDEEWGQRVAAAVVVSEPAGNDELVAWARTRLPGFKTPDEIVTVSALPRNDLGKLQRSQVRSMFGTLRK
jgi:acyl-CoA synthetase (AMP-forming)/AMP-acid ligase II